MSSKTVLLLIPIILALIQTAVCIKCYQCQSDTNDHDCGTEFAQNKEFERECGKKFSVCYEVSYIMGSGIYRTLRSCGLSSVCNISDNCSTCTTDFCNDGVVSRQFH